MSIEITIDVIPPPDELVAEMRGEIVGYMHAWAVEAGHAMKDWGPYTSWWPAQRFTVNLGPYSQQESIRRWGGVAETAGGETRIFLTNTAVDEDGQHYAARVDEGLRSDGSWVSPERFAANEGCIEHTLVYNQDEISRRAEERAAKRKSALPRHLR